MRASLRGTVDEEVAHIMSSSSQESSAAFPASSSMDALEAPKTISIVIPCRNEQESLPLLYERIGRVAHDMASEWRGLLFELILVDDGSTDETLAVMKDLARDQVPPMEVRYIELSRNFGKEAALYAGLAHARGEYVAIMDADMQDPPELLPAMYRALVQDGYDCAAAYRSTRTGESRIRSAGARMFYRIINSISEVEIKDGARDFRLMKRCVVDAVLSMSEYNRFSKGLFSWVGFKTTWISYENRERVAGSSSWSFRRLMSYALGGMTAFSTRPLTFASTFGFVLCLLALLSIIFIIVRTLIFGDPVSGWPSLVCVIVFVGGLQLFFLGIVGRYLANTYLEVKRRPLYFIRETNIEGAHDKSRAGVRKPRP